MRYPGPDPVVLSVVFMREAGGKALKEWWAHWERIGCILYL